MKYQNPIIRGFHPDPSICRVGSDYYLVTSTFEYFPGIALFHSRDLVNWEQIGNCITKPGQLDYSKFKDSGGVWAPTIRYHKGRFYVTVAIDGMGNMIMHTDDINGEWSDPVWTDFGGIDPSICFDGDDAYYCTNDFTNGHEAIVLAKIDPATGIRKEERREIWNGTGGGWLESPHVYHIGDYYYVLAAEGGTSFNHMETAARSKNIYGPYENCPYNPILTNKNDTTKQIQCAGHADLVDDKNGNWWMVHLGTRSVLKSKTPLGRETFLTPVEWKEGWPVAVNKRAKLENELDRTVCRTQEKIGQNKNGQSKIMYGQIETERNTHTGNSFHFKPNFSTPSWEPQWLWLREPDTALYERTSNVVSNELSNALILHPSVFDFEAPAQPCFIGICQPDIDCHFQTTFTFEPKEGEEGGMLLYLSTNFYYRICKRKQNGKTQLAVIRKLDDVEVTDYTKELEESTKTPITLFIDASASGYHITWKTEDGPLEDAGTYSVRFLCTEMENRCFTGTIIGVYAADHTITQQKTNKQEKQQNLQYDTIKQEPLKTKRSNNSMTVTNFEAAVCQTPLDYAKASCETMMRKFHAEDLPPKGHFHYHQGVFLSGVYQTYCLCKNETYFDYIKHWVDSCINEDGTLKLFDAGQLDDIQPGILFYPLMDRAEKMGDKEDYDRYKKILDSLMEIILKFPKNKEGGFWHKDCFPDQMWLDGLYMGGPICAEYGARFNRPEFFDIVAEQALLMKEKTQDEKTGLLYHAYDSSRKESWSDPVTGHSSEFWGRSIGWVPVALLNDLDFIPENHPKRKELEDFATSLLKTLCQYQSKEGRWYQVVNKGDCAGNWLENSCSCLYSAAIAKAVRKGLLSKEYLAYAKKGYEAVIHSLKWEGGNLLVGDVCIGTGVGTYEYYCERPTSVNDLHGVGAFLIMCTEMEAVASL